MYFERFYSSIKKELSSLFPLLIAFLTKYLLAFRIMPPEPVDQNAVIREVRDAFFQWKPFSSVKESVRACLEINRDSFQAEVLQVMTAQSCSDFPVDPFAGGKFLRKLILLLEEMDMEVEDELYEMQVNAAQPTQGNGDVFKTYFLKDDVTVRLKERRAFLSSGTTGLQTWEAGKYLFSWLQKNKEAVPNGATVLELGAGLGFVGISLLKLGIPLNGKVILTDCHEEVLNALRINCQINGLKDDSYSVQALDWLTFDSVTAEMLKPDLVIASDVVFDPNLLGALAKTLQLLLSASAKIAFVACTIRNEETILKFQEELQKKQLTFAELVQDAKLSEFVDKVVIFSIQL